MVSPCLPVRETLFEQPNISTFAEILLTGFHCPLNEADRVYRHRASRREHQDSKGQPMIDSIASLVTAASATQLALAAFLSIAAAGIAYTFFKSAPVWARLVAFLGILVFAFLLSIRLIAPAPAAPAQGFVGKISQINLVKLLKTFPPELRLEKCALVEPDADACVVIVDAIADLAQAPTSPALQQEVTQALKQGTVSQALLSQAVRAVPQSDLVVSLGNAKGWDVDAFWCRGGSNEASARAQADNVAKVLASAGTLAPGVVIGRVRVRALDAGKPGYPKPGDGGFISVDQMRGKPEAVAAIRATLNRDAGLSYADRATKSGLPTYISIFECRGTVPSAVRVGQKLKN
jgi:hypothetical protein